MSPKIAFFAKSTQAVKKYLLLCCTSRVPIKGKLSVCVICMKYGIFILIIIIISPGQILLSYIPNTSHTRSHVQTRTMMQLTTLFDGSLAINRGRSLVHSNKHGRHSFREFLGVFRLQKMARPN